MKRSDISRGFVAFLLAALLAWQVEARTSTSVTYATNDLTTVWGAAVTPEKFEVALKRAKDWCDRNTPDGMPKLITVNSW